MIIWIVKFTNDSDNLEMWLLYFVRFRNYCRNKVEKLLHHNNFVYFAEKKKHYAEN